MLSTRRSFAVFRSVVRVRWLRAAIAVAVTAVAVTACGGGDSAGPPVVTAPPTVRSVAVTPVATTIRIGEAQPLSAVVDAANGAGTGVSWTSEAPAVATVSSTGTVTAIAVGTATIRATATADAKVSGTATITVQSVRGMTVTPTTLTLGAGQTQTVLATVRLDPGQATTISWRTTAAAIATVSATGVVAGVAPGVATITAVAVADTTVRATVAVSVVPAIRAVTVTPPTAALFIGMTQPLTVTVTADAGLAQTVAWRSSNPAAATVNASGVVTAVGFGTSTITVLSTVDTTRRATSVITVTPRTTSVSITQRNVGLNPGTSLALTGIVSADPGIGTGVAWSSGASSVVSITAQGVVSGVSLGSALITATSTADPTKRDTVTVSVVPRLATAWSASRLGASLRDDVPSIVAVGPSEAFAVDVAGDIYRWNGTAWALSLGSTADYLAVHASSATNVIAVGLNGAIARWNGTAWSTMTSGTTRALNAVWVESATTAWAVGVNGTILRLATNTWSTETSGSTRTLQGVWAGDNVAYAVGSDGEVLRRTAGAWARVTVPSGETLYGVHGLSATDVVVVGSNGTLLRWNGTVWSTLGVGGFTGSLYQISGSAANGGRRYFVGDGGVGQVDAGIATVVNTPYAPQMYGISVDATGTAWASGARGAVMRSADGGGATWSTNNLVPDLLDVWTTAASNAFAVGEFGFIYRWNGSSWTKLASPTQATLTTVWGTAAGDGFIGGEQGTMLRWNGSTWTAMTFPSSSTVSALWGVNSSNVYATTKAGEVLQFNGSVWRVAVVGGAPLWSVFGASANDVYAAGEGGTVLRVSGATPTALPLLSGTMTGVWLTGGTNVLAVGANVAGTTGVAFRYNGSAWSTLTVGATPGLTALWGASAFDLYATGDLGTLLRYDGSTWSSIPTGTTDLLWSVSGAPNATGGAFAVGLNGTIVAGATSALRASGTAGDAPIVGTLEPSARATVRRGALPSGAARKRRSSR
ncbi:MAG: Ig-like domain-containing protein [Gemmatimonadota bacterium]|nr:Ig-like domain-containing protein [Gemmatimonadota bacterium]MDQ8168954.1 Ig-like domain-containing protein [Gemmatimonadota bacterium]